MTFKRGTIIIGKIEDIFLMICLASIFLLLLTQVVSRYIFNMPLTWTEELAKFLQIWITYIGISLGLRYNAHVKITVLYDRFSPRGRSKIQIFLNLVILFCFSMILPSSFIYLADQSLIRSATLKLPMHLVSISLVAGFIMAMLHILAETITEIFKLSENKRGFES